MYIDNIKLKKLNLAIILILLLTILIGIPSYAADTDTTFRDIENDIDKQNEKLYESILDNKQEGSNNLESVFKEADRKNSNGGADFNISDLSGVASALEINSIKLALWARKYVVPFTVLMILFNVFMLATSAKNYSNRKKYILGSVFLYVFFLIILNFPLYLLWRYSMGPGTPFSFDWFFDFVEGLTLFLKEQSFMFSIIVLSYGIVNYIGSKNDLPRLLASKFIMKTSMLMFVLFQILPLVLKLAV